MGNRLFSFKYEDGKIKYEDINKKVKAYMKEEKNMAAK